MAISVQPTKKPFQHNPQWGAKPREPEDEYFWHATTWEGLKGLYKASAIEPNRGTGANGNGFYVCPQRSDYQKVMAYRNIKTDEDKRRGLFLLKILARGFYNMKGSYANGLGVAMGGEDFAASRWASDVMGDTKNKRPDRTPAMYDQRTKLTATPMAPPAPLAPLPGAPATAVPLVFPSVTATPKSAGTVVVKNKLTLSVESGPYDLRQGLTGKHSEKAKVVSAALETLWQLAVANAASLPYGAITTTGLELLDRVIHAKGARKAFRYTLEELAFRASVGPKLFIVDAYRFYYTGPNTDPSNDDYDHEQHVDLAALGAEIEATL